MTLQLPSLIKIQIPIGMYHLKTCLHAALQLSKVNKGYLKQMLSVKDKAQKRMNRAPIVIIWTSTRKVQVKWLTRTSTVIILCLLNKLCKLNKLWCKSKLRVSSQQLIAQTTMESTSIKIINKLTILFQHKAPSHKAKICSLSNQTYKQVIHQVTLSRMTKINSRAISKIDNKCDTHT